MIGERGLYTHLIEIWANYKDPIQDDKGISWFELMINYSVCTQKRLPVQIAVEGRFYTYAPFDTDIAAIQPEKVKTANYHAYGLEKLVRQMENLSMKKTYSYFSQICLQTMYQFVFSWFD